MVIKTSYNPDTRKYEIDSQLLEPYGLTTEEVATNFELVTTTVNALHGFKRLMILLSIFVNAFIIFFFLAIGGVATYLCHHFKQTVYIYLVVWACVALLIFLGVIFNTVSIRAFGRNRSEVDYENCKHMFKSDSLTKYKSKGCRMELKFDPIAHGIVAYTFRAQYPYIEISKLDGSDVTKQGETSTLIPAKKERRKSGKFEDINRGRSKSGVSYSRVADM